MEPTTSQPTISWLPIAISSVASLLVGLLLGQYLSLKPAPTLPIPIPLAVSTPVLDPTANWKTYTASGFTFKYPLDWQVGQPTHFPDEYRIQPSAIFDPELEKNGIQIAVSSSCLNTQCLTIFDLDGYVKNWSNVKVIGQSNVDNTKAYKVSMPNGDTGYMLVKDKTAITFSTNKYFTELDQILSTFKFTNQKTSQINQNQAAQLVSALPDIVAWQKLIVSKGQSRAVVAFDHENDSSYVIHVFEEFSDHTATYNWYDVDKFGKITKEF